MEPGATVSLTEKGTVRIRGRGVGRLDFKALELVVNGRIVHSVSSRPSEGHFVADLDFTLQVSEPGWVALRIPPGLPENELDRSPVRPHQPHLSPTGRPVHLPARGRP